MVIQDLISKGRWDTKVSENLLNDRMKSWDDQRNNLTNDNEQKYIKKEIKL